MTQPKKSGIGPKTIKWIWAIAFAPFVLLALMLALTALGVFGRMPSFEELENPRSNLATEVYSEDGKVIGTFFVQMLLGPQLTEWWFAGIALMILGFAGTALIAICKLR